MDSLLNISLSIYSQQTVCVPSFFPNEGLWQQVTGYTQNPATYFLLDDNQIKAGFAQSYPHFFLHLLITFAQVNFHQQCYSPTLQSV